MRSVCGVKDLHVLDFDDRLCFPTTHRPKYIRVCILEEPYDQKEHTVTVDGVSDGMSSISLALCELLL